MKFSLRSLMVVFTLACVVPGAAIWRVEYLRRWAKFYEQELEGFKETFSELPEMSPEWQIAGQAMVQNSIVAQRYRDAIYRPWAAVDDTPPTLTLVPPSKASQ